MERYKMEKRIYGRQSDTLLSVIEAEPECGEDFCDLCGDCLSCYGGDPCMESKRGEHSWVVYVEEPAEENSLKS